MAGRHDHHRHPHGSGAAVTIAARRRALVVALVANAALFVGQLAAALVFGSLALLADTAHLATDVVALALALVAHRIALRPATARTTYGWERAEVIAGVANAILLAAATVWIAVEAIGRFSSPHHIDGAGVAVVGAVGLVVNAGSAVVVGRASGGNLNLRSAFWHLASDAIGSFAVVVAGVVEAVTDTTWVDPAVSLLIAALVLAAAWGLVRDAMDVLMERAPAGIDPDDVAATLAAEPRVSAVHHVHVWSLGSETAALSAHVVLAGEPSLHDAQLVGNDLRELLAREFGIDHATLELECHDCADTVHGPIPQGAPER